MAIRKLASEIVVGDYLDANSHIADCENGPDPSDCELSLCRVDRVMLENGGIVFYTDVGVAMIPGDPSDFMECELARYHSTELVYTYTEAEAEVEHRRQLESAWEYCTEQRNK